MLRRIEDINIFANKCGCFFNACIEKDISINNGYNCTHPGQEEFEEVNGQKIGKCYSFSCPLCPVAEEADFNDPSIDNQGYEYEESKYVLIVKDYKYEYNGWDFKLEGFNQIQKAYKVTAKKDDLIEAMFVEDKYIEEKEDFEKECRRFYDNCLYSFD